MSLTSINTQSHTLNTSTTPITILQRPTTMTMLTKTTGDLTMTFSKRNAVLNGFKVVDGSITDSSGATVCPGLHKMAEFSVSVDNINDIKNHSFFNEQNFQDIEQYIVSDGTMIRLFYHNGEWRKATNRRIDANNASWGPVKSFGALFDDAAEYNNLDYSKLNIENCYIFVLQHPVNRIVEPVSSFPILHHIDTVHVSSGVRIMEDIGIKKSNEITYQSLNEMAEFLMDAETPWMFQGFLLINSRNERLKLENPKYTHVHNVKGNIITETGAWKMNENVHAYSFRLFQIIRDGHEPEFLKYFPEFVQPMITIKEDMYHLAKLVWETYKQRYIIKNMEFPQSPELKTFLNYLHYQYHTTKESITFDKCMTVVKSCPTSKLMHTLKYTTYK
jgi:hypothetical protein